MRRWVGMLVAQPLTGIAMNFVTNRRTQPMMLFFALALVINATASVLSHHHFATRAAHLISYAVCFDMTLTVPALYYLLLVRRGIQTVSILLLILLLCVVRASFVIPAVVHGAFVLGAAELGILVLICAKVRDAMRSADSILASDPMEHIDVACRAFIPVGPIAQLMASDFAVLYYALLSWGASKTKQDGKRFSTHRNGGLAVVLMVLACLTTIEIPIVHLVLARWNKTIAWVFTGLGIYGFVWMIGLSRSFVLRPAVISEVGLKMNKGFLWRVQVRWTDIAAIERAGHTWNSSAPETLNLAVGVAPDLLLEFAHPVTATGAFGLGRQVRTVAVCIDDAKAFEASLPARLRSAQH